MLILIENLKNWSYLIIADLRNEWQLISLSSASASAKKSKLVHILGGLKEQIPVTTSVTTSPKSLITQTINVVI